MLLENQVLTTRISKEVQALGKSAREIAQRLREMGVCGKRGNAGCCPLANYLRSRLGLLDADVVCVNDNVAIVRTNGTVWYGTLTRAAHEFVDGFDCGVYPFLLQQGRPS